MQRFAQPGGRYKGDSDRLVNVSPAGLGLMGSNAPVVYPTGREMSPFGLRMGSPAKRHSGLPRSVAKGLVVQIASADRPSYSAFVVITTHDELSFRFRYVDRFHFLFPFVVAKRPFPFGNDHGR